MTSSNACRPFAWPGGGAARLGREGMGDWRGRGWTNNQIRHGCTARRCERGGEGAVARASAGARARRRD
eukprot:2670660-Pyramimonas_sp.AAC.1